MTVKSFNSNLNVSKSRKMNSKRSGNVDCTSEAEIDVCNSKFHEKCAKCYRKHGKSSNTSLMGKRFEDSSRFHVKTESNYVTHIVFVGIRSDDIYEVKLLLAPEVDITSIRITVKNKNLRVSVQKTKINESAKHFMSPITEKSPNFSDISKKTTKHSENFLIPETIDGDKVRAVIDIQNRTLILTAPNLKTTKAFKRRFSSLLNL